MEKQKMLSEYSEVVHRVAKDVLNRMQSEIRYRAEHHENACYIEEVNAMYYLKKCTEEVFRERYNVNI